jgi:hypothetical protein
VSHFSDEQLAEMAEMKPGKYAEKSYMEWRGKGWSHDRAVEQAKMETCEQVAEQVAEQVPDLLSNLLADLREARKVLEPFAKIADKYDELDKKAGDRTGDKWMAFVQLGYCRAARAALQPEASTPEGDAINNQLPQGRKGDSYIKNAQDRRCYYDERRARAM